MVDEITLSTAAQMCKLEVVLKALNQELGLGDEEDSTAKWSAKRV